MTLVRILTCMQLLNDPLNGFENVGRNTRRTTVSLSESHFVKKLHGPFTCTYYASLSAGRRRLSDLITSILKTPHFPKCQSIRIWSTKIVVGGQFKNYNLLLRLFGLLCRNADPQCLNWMGEIMEEFSDLDHRLASWALPYVYKSFI